MIRAALIWLALTLPLAAQDLPDWQHTSINDFAGLLSDDDTRLLDQALIDLFQQTDIEGTVVTLPDRAAYGGSDGLEAFATRLFNHWGVGDPGRNDGFMLLVLADDREARIELGAGYSPEADIVAQDIMRNIMLPAFRDARLSEGIREGTLAVIDHIAQPSARGETPRRVRQPVPLIPALIGLGIAGIVAQGIARNILRRVRHSRRPCPQCGGRGLVDETQPDPQAPQDAPPSRIVWRRCPRCGWRSEGERRRQRAGRPSGRGGGFGGGRSSGGGASGRW